MARTQRTRRQLDLLDRLVDLMAAEGFARFTLDDLALRMRCSKTTLYALADSKQGLVVEVVKQYFRTAADRVEEGVAARDEESRWSAPPAPGGSSTCSTGWSR